MNKVKQQQPQQHERLITRGKKHHGIYLSKTQTISSFQRAHFTDEVQIDKCRGVTISKSLVLRPLNSSGSCPDQNFSAEVGPWIIQNCFSNASTKNLDCFPKQSWPSPPRLKEWGVCEATATALCPMRKTP